MLFPEALLEDIAPAEIFRRGQRYYWDHAVSRLHLTINRKGQILISGHVRGGRDYRVRLVIAPQARGIDDFRCSCPFDGGSACKHVIALGLAAMSEPSPAAASEANDKLKQALRQFARERHLPLQPDDLENFTRRLEKLGVSIGSAAPRALPKQAVPKNVWHKLDNVRLAIRYQAAEDTVAIVPWAHYGPLKLPLMSNVAPSSVIEAAAKDKHVVHVADRDWEAERSAYRELARRFATRVNAETELGEFFITGNDIYWFATETLLELGHLFELDIDASLEPLLNIQQREIDSAWSTSQAKGQGWFDFSVDWYCGQTKLELEQLKRMAASHQPFIRQADGSFIECVNRDDIKRFIELLDGAEAKADGSYRSKLFFAPEMLALLQHTQSARLASMNETFQTFLRDVKTGKVVDTIRWPARLGKILRPYQKDGVAWLKFLQAYGFGGILADDMGLGKTLQILALLSISKASLGAPSLIVCPKTLTLTWANEIAKFTPELSYLIMDGTVAERELQAKRMNSHDLIITPYSLIPRDIGSYHGRKQPFAYCILDEAQYIKNAQTATAQAVKLIPARYRLALTGTPLENGVHELWSIFDFLMPGFLGQAKEFRVRFERPIHERQDTGALQALRTKVKPFVLRRTKDSQLKELPPKIEQTSQCNLTPEQLVVYTRTLQQVRQDVFRAVEDKGFKRSRIEILSALMKLRRICDHPALVDPRLPRTEEVSGKMALVMELIQEATAGGHKVLLFSQFTSMLDILRDALTKQAIGHCTIEGKTRDRQAQVQKFCEDPLTSVFLLSLKAGGTGLTLIEADTVILVDPWWNPQVERQAMDRAHRIGQSKTVNVYKIVTKGTVEEKVVQLQRKKQQIFDALMTENAESIAALTWEDLRELFE